MEKILVANWKLNPETLEEAKDLASKTDLEGVILCPPVLFLEEVKSVLKRAKLGSQDVFFEDEGPFTGEISPSQLKGLGVEYSIVGHSERRSHLNEADEMINKKVKAALDENITPILCVGESKEIHDQGEDAVREFIKDQLGKDLSGVEEGVVVAYEPIWAIGTKAEDPQEAASTISYIKELLDKNTPVLYGGSVNKENIESFVKEDAIDGFLVGGASLDPDQFNSIAQSI